MRLVIVIGAITTTVLLFQSFMLPYRSLSFSLFSVDKVRTFSSEGSYPMSTRDGGLSLSNDSSRPSVVLEEVKKTELSDVRVESEHNDRKIENEYDPVDHFALEEVSDPNDDFAINKDSDMDNESFSLKIRDPRNDFIMEKVLDPGDSSMLEKVAEAENGFPVEMAKKLDDGFLMDSVEKSDDIAVLEKGINPYSNIKSPLFKLSIVVSDMNWTKMAKIGVNDTDSAISVPSNVSPVGKQASGMISKGGNWGLLQNSLTAMNGNSTTANFLGIKKQKQVMPSSPLSEMHRLLRRSHASSRPVKSRLSSLHRKDLLSAKKQIENAPVVKDDHELYAPVFRNVSMFIRSYQLMERMLKVYIYREGEKPIFHKPLLKGIYANEGWFMKLIEGNKRFVVKDPRKAHLFYLPFSSRLLQITMYVPGSHSLKNLEEYLKKYVDKIAAKYPFWNRTGGADHFLVACHDWAPYETRHNMENSIRALCNADLSRGFKLGKDVSLPESYVRSARNPLRDLGGNPASQRPTIAFYAGNMHGSLRPVLLKYWENKDPDMKILGPMPPGVESKMAYIQHMKNQQVLHLPKGLRSQQPKSG